MLHSNGISTWGHCPSCSEPACFRMEQLENTWASQSYSSCLLLSQIKLHSMEPQALYPYPFFLFLIYIFKCYLCTFVLFHFYR